MSDYDFKADRKEKLERRLATARRVAALPVDPLTKERVDGFIQELEVELGKGSAGISLLKICTLNTEKLLVYDLESRARSAIILLVENDPSRPRCICAPYYLKCFQRSP